MKGLYIKDFKLMMNQKMFFIVIAAMAIFFAVTQTNIFFELVMLLLLPQCSL